MLFGARHRTRREVIAILEVFNESLTAALARLRRTGFRLNQLSDCLPMPIILFVDKERDCARIAGRDLRSRV